MSEASASAMSADAKSSTTSAAAGVLPVLPVRLQMLVLRHIAVSKLCAVWLTCKAGKQLTEDFLRTQLRMLYPSEAGADGLALAVRFCESLHGIVGFLPDGARGLPGLSPEARSLPDGPLIPLLERNAESLREVSVRMETPRVVALLERCPRLEHFYPEWAGPTRGRDPLDASALPPGSEDPPLQAELVRVMRSCHSMQHLRLPGDDSRFSIALCTELLSGTPCIASPVLVVVPMLMCWFDLQCGLCGPCASIAMASSYSPR